MNVEIQPSPSPEPTPAAPKPAPVTPRLRAPVLDATLAAQVGRPSPGSTHWRIQRKGEHQWAACESPQDGVYIREWPISELSTSRIRDTWRSGLYRITWIIRDDNNPVPKERCRLGGQGRPFRVEDPEPEPVQAVPPAPVQAPDALASVLGPAFQLMGAVDQQATARLEALRALAEGMRDGGARGGDGGMGAVMMLMMQQQQQAFQAQLAQSQQFQAELQRQREGFEARLAAREAALREEYGDTEPEEEAEGPRPAFTPGEPMGDQLKALIGNVIVEMMPSVIPVIAAKVIEFGKGGSPPSNVVPIQQRPALPTELPGPNAPGQFQP